MSKSSDSGVGNAFLLGIAIVLSASNTFADEPARTPAPLVLPVNLGLASKDTLSEFSEELSKAVGTLNEAGTTTKSSKQKLLRSLPSTDMFVYVLEASTAAKLGIVVLSAETAKHSTVIVQEYLIYKDVTDSSKSAIYRVGVGVRMIIIVNETSARVATLGLPQIAADVQNRKLQATIRLQTIGLSGKLITESSPMPAELNFTTLMQMYQAVDRIKSAIWDDDTAPSGTTITPQVIGWGKV